MKIKSIRAAAMTADAAAANGYTRTTAKNNKLGYEVIKRGQDVMLSSAALLILSPVMAVTAAAIYLDDPHGSPIFKQERVGKDGELFTVYKFRSMYVDAEERKKELLKDNEMDGPVFKIKDDPRITRVGKFIRKVSIDELPQLVNILKGDMTIVGPRPGLPCEAKEYTPYERHRLDVTPGLTCYWQVQPHRNDIPFKEWMDLDIKYIQDRSFIKDWQIIFKTFGAVFGGHGE